MCDVCGKTVYCQANYNKFHDLYEDGLPDGWEFIDGSESKFVSRTGDYCSECLDAFSHYIEKCYNKWVKYDQFKGSKIPIFAHNDMMSEPGFG